MTPRSWPGEQRDQSFVMKPRKVPKTKVCFVWRNLKTFLRLSSVHSLSRIQLFATPRLEKLPAEGVAKKGLSGSFKPKANPRSMLPPSLEAKGISSLKLGD